MNPRMIWLFLATSALAGCGILLAPVAIPTAAMANKPIEFGGTTTARRQDDYLDG